MRHSSIRSVYIGNKDACVHELSPGGTIQLKVDEFLTSYSLKLIVADVSHLRYSRFTDNLAIYCLYEAPKVFFEIDL